MSVKGKFGIAWALVFVAVAAAPALACLSYLAQDINTHGCCPQEKPPEIVLARCCFYSPAATARSLEIPAPIVAAAMSIVVDPAELTSGVEPLLIPILHISPPGCSSILRI